MVSRWKINIMALLFYMVISSCNSTKANPPVSSPTVRVTASVSSTLSIQGRTPTPQHTTTPSISPTITLIPALPVAEAESKVVELLHDNGGCQFPCFWGFTPGKTSVQVAHSILHSFLSVAPDDFLFGERGGGVGILIPNDDFLLSTHIIIRRYDNPLQQDTLRWLQIDVAIYREGGANYAYDSPLYAQYFQYYTLAGLLSNYGKPTNVYINFENDMGFHEYYLFLDYTESGWVAMLKMPLTQKGESLISCPTQAFTRLWLWSPEDTETAKEYGFVGGSALKSIGEATSLSLEEFYQQYKNPANTTCLETPADIYIR